MELTKTKYKQTEIGLIPEEWQVRTLKDIGDVKMCRRIFSYQTKKASDIPFYKIGTFGKKPDAYITKELFNEYKSRFSFPKKGDILISAAGTIGRTVVYNGEEAYFQDSNIVWLDNNNKIVSNEYLQYVYKIIRYRTEGNTIQRLYNSIIYNTPIICPPLPEQKAIAEVLSDVDSLIQAIEQKLAKKRAIKQGAMQKLLTPPSRTSGQGKEDWEVKKLGEIGKCYRGVSYNTENDLYPFDNEKSLRLLRSNNIQNSQIDLNSIQFVSNKRVKAIQKMKTDDILICMANGSKELVGKAALFQENDSYSYTFGAFMGCFKTELLNANPKYIYYNFNSFNYRSFIAHLLSGSSINNLKPSDIESIEILFPSFEEQIKIASILMDMDKEIELIEQQLAKYQVLKQGLMQELLTGRIRLTV